MTGTRHKLRTRLAVAMAGIAIGALVLTAVTTLGLARRVSTTTAEDQLQQKAPQVVDTLEELGRRIRLRRNAGTGVGAVGQLVAATLRISNGGLVTVTPEGEVTDGLVGLAGIGKSVFSQPGNANLLQLPAGLSVDDLDTKALLAGREQSGRRGGIVFVAQPLTPGANGTPVLLLTQKVDEDAIRKTRGFFLIAALAAIGLSIVIAVFLARRMTRPLAAMGDAARSVSAGDLSARVNLGRHPDDELADLAATLNTMAAQLEHARGMERAFILSVSHDLRTPLTSIRGYAEAMLDGAIGTDDERARAAHVISTEARRLERLVADLLDLARLDTRQFSLTPHRIDAAGTVLTAVDAFRPAASDLGIAFQVEGPSTMPAEADPDRLAQIVANLVENALKYAASTIVVELVAYATGDLDLRVRDDGPGISADDLPQVFDRLYVSRTTPGRSLGTGIGLAIVRELAGAMGGQAWVDAAGDAGATFVVRLPILVPVTSPSPTP